MPALEIFQDLRQLRRCILISQGQNTVNDVVGPGLVSGVQVARLRGRLEWPHDNSGRIGSKIKSLAVQELNL